MLIIMDVLPEIENVREARVPNPDTLLSAHSRVPQTLKKLGFDGLRQGQSEAINTILAGEDAIVLLPTGVGKSAIYIIATDVNDWKTVIFSPLVALMQDQLSSLQLKGFRAAQLSSIQQPQENELALQRWIQGDLDYLIVTPERLSNEKFCDAMKARPPDMTTIDECHTLSQWSDNFRPDYCKIGLFIEEYDPKIVLCMTATCPKQVEADVRRVVGVPDAKKICYMPPRKNLLIETRQWENDEDLLNTINSIAGPVIIYCATVKTVDHLYMTLADRVVGSAVKFHGKLSPADKTANQGMFMGDQSRVVFATNAFGMGIDKPDIRGVIHRDMPGSLECYSQEFGRGGRDGGDCECVLYLDEGSVRTQKWFLDIGHPSKRDVTAFFNTLKSRSSMEGLCTASIKDIMFEAGCDRGTDSAILSILYGAQVIVRTKDKTYAHVKILKEHIDPRFQEYFKIIEDVGTLEQGYYEVNIDDIALQAGVKPATIRNNLKALDSAGYIEFAPPPPRPPIKILGDLELVEFQRLKEKEVDDNAKFQLMLEFCNTPDADKHQYMFDYFVD